MTQTMSWGLELWDQYPALWDHTQKGIDFLDKYGQFMKERCAIEVEYAGKLKRLAKHHQLKKKDEEDNQFSYCKAFLTMLQEVTDMAGQHEVIAETITANIVKEIVMQLKELKEERKRYLQEGQRHQNSHSVSLTQLDKAKKSYEKAFKEAEKAREAYEKADADLNLSRAEVEKAKNFSFMKGQICEETKNEYANQLQKTNELQARHFKELMPKVFSQLQEMEERRITCLQSYVKQSALIQRQVFPIIDKCIEGIVKAADSIAPADDSMMVIERFKSGNLPPEDIPFEDLSNPSPPDSLTLGINASDFNGCNSSGSSSGSRGSNQLNYSHSVKSGTLSGTLSVSRFKKRVGIFGMFGGSNKGMNYDEKSDDYADLPPIQRRKKILQKIDATQAQINQEMAVRDGLMKMKAAYESNPSMGDPQSVQGQMVENGQKLDKLHRELQKFQGYLEDVDNITNKGPGTPYSQKRKSSTNSNASSTTNQQSLSQSALTTGVASSGLGRHSQRNSISEDSLSRSASDSSFSHTPTQPTSAASNITNTSPTTQSSVQKNNNPSLLSSSVINQNNVSSSTIIKNQQNNTYNQQNGVTSNGSRVSDSSKSSLTLKANGGSPERSPESGISTSHLSIPDADYADADADEVDFEDHPVLGRAKALYLFEAQSEGAIDMEEGEDLEVVELDQGDGWTRVRRTKTDEEGFVPTTYLDIEIDANC